jgi:hypothetical protein
MFFYLGLAGCALAGSLVALAALPWAVVAIGAIFRFAALPIIISLILKTVEIKLSAKSHS